MKKIAIVTINYNNHQTTTDLLNQLYSLPENFNYSIYVVDNNSQDNSADALEAFLARGKKYETHLLLYKKNYGFSGGCNLAIKEALHKGVDYVLIINNDTVVNKSFLQNLVVFAEEKGPCIISPKIYFAKGYEFHKRYKKEELGSVLWYAGGILDWKNVYGNHRGVDEVDRGQYDNAEETDFVSGCCMLVTASIFKDAGFFDENYFLYYEDADLSVRVRSKEYKLYYFPKSEIWHKNAASAGGSGSELQDYYITRNRMIFGMKHAPFRSKLSLLRESFSILRKGRDWQKKAIADFYLRNLGKGSFPVS